jgi:hypothetical protein
LQKEYSEISRGELVVEYLILFYLSYFLKSPIHQKKLLDLQTKLETTKCTELVESGMDPSEKPITSVEQVTKLVEAQGHRSIYWASILGR